MIFIENLTESFDESFNENFIVFYFDFVIQNYCNNIDQNSYLQQTIKCLETKLKILCFYLMSSKY